MPFSLPAFNVFWRTFVLLAEDGGTDMAEDEELWINWTAIEANLEGVIESCDVMGGKLGEALIQHAIDAVAVGEAVGVGVSVGVAVSVGVPVKVEVGGGV